MIEKLLTHYLNVTYGDRICRVYYYNEYEGNVTIVFHYKYIDFEDVEHKQETTVSMLELIAFTYVQTQGL